MKSWLVVCTIGFWGLFFLDSTLFWGAAAGFLLYLLVRFRSPGPPVLFMLLALLAWSMQADPHRLEEQPPAGRYTVTEIRNSYCLASNGKNKILIQNMEEAAFGDILMVRQFERIHTLHNDGVFCFEEYLKTRHIVWQTGQADLICPAQSVQARLYRYFSDNDLARLFLYHLPAQDTEQDSWIQALGLPVSGFTMILCSLLTLRLGSEKAFWISLALLLLYGHFFMWSLSLARLILFRLCSRIKEWSVQWSLQVFVFLLLFPWAYAEFTLVLPAVLSFGRHFAGRYKRLFCLWIIAVLQIVYFGKIDLFTLMGFSLLTKLWGLLFLGGTVVLVLEAAVPWIPAAASVYPVHNVLLYICQQTVPSCSWKGQAALWISMLFCLAFVMVCWKPDDRRMLLCWGCIGLYMASFWLDPFFHVYQLDIGQGDCCVIVEPFQKSVIMIDAAGTMHGSQADNVIIPFLESRHLTKINALILTHADADHAGSRDDLVRKWNIEQVIETRDAQVPVDYPFESLLIQREAIDENDQSIISFFSYDGFSYLYTGDASENVEKQLIKQYSLSADILKVGHHGSKTASSQAFLEAVNPTLALISAGYHNRYNHPDRSVIRRLHQLGIDILQTQVQGMIHMFSWQGWMLIVCADGTVSLICPKNADV